MLLIAVLSGQQSISIRSSVLALFPIVFSQYWFVIPFLCICLISPWLNNIVHSLDKKSARYYYGLLFIGILIFPIIGNNSVASNITLFIFLYCIGAGLKQKENLYNLVKKHKYTLTSIGFFGSIVVSIIVNSLGYVSWSRILTGRFSPMPLITAVGLLQIFLQFNFKSKIINKLAGSAFAVYLISENTNIYPWMWKEYFDNATYINTNLFIPMSLLQCLFVFTVCIISDLFYKKIKNYLLNI